MMQQFFSIKNQHPDKILFYRMGDFYEMFGDDAVKASEVLQIQLTTRNKNKENSMPMCGFPIHAYEQYLNKLSRAGFKIAVCEQTEDPAQAKGLVKREVVRIITPGTVTAPDLLDAASNRFLGAVWGDMKKNRVGVAFCDLTTGEFEVDGFSIKNGWNALQELLYVYQPHEVLLPMSQTRFTESCEKVIKGSASPANIEYMESFHFEHRGASRNLLDQFKISSLAGFGIDDKHDAVGPAGAILDYLRDTQKDTLQHIASLKRIHKSERMLLDESRSRNLELFETTDGSDKKHTLTGLLDNTKTPMGARLLRRWISAPLLKKESIESRLRGVQSLIDQFQQTEKTRTTMRHIGDLERVIARISMPQSNISDMIRLRTGLEPLDALGKLLQELQGDTIAELIQDFDPLVDLWKMLESHLLLEPKLKPKEGGFIREGVHEKLDELKNLMKNGKQLIANMEAKEKSRTGINSLKIGYNKVFGYFIEIYNTQKHLVPGDYIRKQTLVNSERYVTEELKELEESILNAEDESKLIEFEMFEQLKETLRKEVKRIQETAAVLAEVDVLGTFAYNALNFNYVCPQFSDNPHQRVLNITEGRHPVIESLNFDEPFIPNNSRLDSDDQFIVVITGPNMGGKSTYMRQVALIALMAQIGSFVPATSAELPIFDRIFTRVGASDNLTRGQSTFMVEMSEAASILNNATTDSLIILDEIGRGTSTFDGISIAWAIVEHLHQLRSLTLFATHYHELILLEDKMEGVSNAKVVVHEENDTIVFLRKVIAGPADKSYGIQVARLAGLPNQVIEKAHRIMTKLEAAEKSFNADETDLLDEPDLETEKSNPYQADIVAEPPSDYGNQQISFMATEDPLLEKIRQFDLNNATPIEAMTFLNTIQREL